MERRVNKRINEYFSGFKQNVKSEISKLLKKIKLIRISRKNATKDCGRFYNMCAIMKSVN